jgi:hypothetical protein
VAEEGYKKRRLANKRAVVALVERGGQARTFHVDRATKAAVTEIVIDNVERETCLHTDEAGCTATPTSSSPSPHREAFGRRIRARVRSHQHRRSVFSVFKRGMVGVYQHCSEKRLHRYLAEFNSRYNARQALGVNDAGRTERALKGIVGKRLTYRTTG